ncbi:hypothetical protein ACLCDV_08145 [Sphingobacterium sp. Lzh-3]|uniref:hypothetical protein n=1 Tax=Sphingobacterium sp. Lzh-3 TaxID=3382150 RepID=UPI00398D5D40
MKTAKTILRQYFDTDNSVDENAIIQAMKQHQKENEQYIKDLKKLLGKYSEYHALTMDGVSPEEADRTVKF